MKTIISPVPEFPGTIELPDYLTLPQVVEYSELSDALLADRELHNKNWARMLKLLPLQLRITGNWNIEGLDTPKPTTENFPFSPAFPSAALLGWLHREITAMIVGEKLLPNPSKPGSINTAKIPAKKRDHRH